MFTRWILLALASCDFGLGQDFSEYRDQTLERHRRSCACVSQYTPVNCKCHQPRNTTELLCRCDRAQMAPQCSCAPSTSVLCSPVCQQQCVQSCLAQQQPMEQCQASCPNTCGSACQQLHAVVVGPSQSTSTVMLPVPQPVSAVSLPHYTVPPMTLTPTSPRDCQCQTADPLCQCHCVPHCTEQCLKNCPIAPQQCAQTCAGSCEVACTKHHATEAPPMFSDCQSKCVPSCRRACTRPQESAPNAASCQEACVGMCEANCRLSTAMGSLMRAESDGRRDCAPLCMPSCERSCVERFVEKADFKNSMSFTPSMNTYASQSDDVTQTRKSQETLNSVNEVRARVIKVGETSATVQIRPKASEGTDHSNESEVLADDAESFLKPLMDPPVEDGDVVPVFHQVRFDPPSMPTRSSASEILEPKVSQRLYNDPSYGPTLSLNIQFPAPQKDCPPECRPRCSLQCADNPNRMQKMNGAKSFFERRFGQNNLAKNNVAFSEPLKPQNDDNTTFKGDCLPSCERVCERECRRHSTDAADPCSHKCVNECLRRCPTSPQ